MSARRPSDEHRDLRPRPGDLGLRLPVPHRAVFEFLPSGVVVLDGTGRVQGTNLRAREMLGPALEREGLRCCDLFGCRRPGTPLADRCITELALERGDPLPEVRVDVATRGGDVESVWLTAARVPGADSYVIAQIRPGVVGDRRRRTEPHWMGGAQLRLFTLGRTRVESGEGPLAGEWLGHRPGHVLKYLTCRRGRIVPVEELIDVFWPQAVARGGATSVRQAVHTLRDRLEPARPRHAPSAFVVARSGGYELEESNVWIDADDFEDSVRQGIAAAERDDPELAEAALMRAVGLYRGDFLADEPYAEWAFVERDRLRDLAGQALGALARIKEEAGDLDAATEQLNRLAELEPFDMDVQRNLLALLLRRNRHAEAHRRYEVVRRRYRRSFGDDPPFALADVAGQRAPD